MISCSVLIFDICLLMPLKYFHLRKNMNLKQLAPTLSNMIEYAICKILKVILALTIFTYLDSLDLSTTEVNSRKPTASPLRS